MQLSLRTDRQLIRAGARSTRYLMISLTAPVAPPRTERPPVNVGLVLDRSGSMDAERKFTLARDAVEQSLRLLRESDTFTLVVYDGEVDVLMPPASATAEAKRTALQRLASVQPRGCTDLHAGWNAGARGLADRARVEKNDVTRLLLLTDGLANAGVTDPHALTRRARDLRTLGVATTTFGVGADFDERLLRDIAHEGGGHFYFVETPAQIPDLLTSELGEALEVVRRDAALRIELPGGAEAEPLNRFRVVRAAGDDELRLELGDLTSGQDVSAVVRILFPRGEHGTATGVRVSVASADPVAREAEQTLLWQYASHAENDAQPRDRAVDREVARLYAARARAEATEFNRHGDYDRARRAIEATARRIQGYTFGDRELQQLRLSLLDELQDFARGPMSAMAMKSALFVAESVAKGRGRDGKARRGGW
jgi:Ca-activated chloride channel family protein